ncbi:MAG: primosomal protein N' [Treponema sp.]|jgi:primosomal protein N' (replication factor Y)|nr:primosomal protein N' [Treponema sp.]
MAPWFDLVFDIPAPQAFTYRADEKGEAAAGKRAMVPFGNRGRDSLGYIIAERDTPPEELSESAIKPIRRVIDAEPVFDEQDASLARWLAAYYLCGIGQALAAMIPSGRRMAAFSGFADDNDDIAPASLDLSAEQQAALDVIVGTGDRGLGTGDRSLGTGDRGLGTGEGDLNYKSTPRQTPAISNIAPYSPIPSPQSPPMYYLYGITGSGKTEVFLRAAEFMLKEGKSVIYLVPEIALTHQMAELIGKRFGSQAAMLHSGMSPSARLAEWSRIRRGEAPVVVGPRSAVFAPLRNLGMIIIDEEHDGSYKSGNTPRYHARQTAIRRCSVEGAKLVMGSATPSAEAWKLMAEGTIVRLNLSRRLSGGAMPEIKPVSLEHAEGCFTAELKEEIRLTARMKRQTILFLNRRGFAYFYHCPSCGYEQSCRRCSVSLTWHKSKGRALCHYCGYSEPPPSACPRCGSLEAGYRGFGTEMIEEEARRTFPDLRIRRADADAAGKKGQLEETIALFRAGMVDILLGTQMVAKGLNFPGVRLVGVILADTSLHLPDFRAAERTFSLIVQVAGRAGRYFPDGKVIVQTLRMGDPVITRSCAVDVEGFFNAELSQRRALKFPPYTRLIRFNVRSRDAARADTAIKRLAALAAPLIPPGADMLGPAECPIGIINGNHRRQLILRGPSMGTLHGAARLLWESYEQGRDARVYLEVDVDPVNLL